MIAKYYESNYHETTIMKATVMNTRWWIQHD